MVSFEDSIKAIRSLAAPFKKEYILLENADGRILAENIITDRPYPPFNRAAMDGFAIMQNDYLEGVRKYKVAEVIYAGRPATVHLTSGYCYKIMTGASTPEPANLIIRKEDALQRGQDVLLEPSSVKEFQNIARKGEDTQTGEEIFKAPLRCDPQTISLLAAIGKTNILAYALPSVSLITTGDEIIDPGETVNSLQIRNSNQYLLKSLLKKWNITPDFCTHIPDNKNLLRKALKKAITADITIINGGVSAGDADFIPLILEELNVENILNKANIRPGKPIWIGKNTTGGVVFALPGNPLSCLTTFTIFIESYLSEIFCYPGRCSYKLPLLQKKSKNHNMTEFFPVKINNKTWGLDVLLFNGSGDITAGAGASGLAIFPADLHELEIGDPVDFYPFNNYL